LRSRGRLDGRDVIDDHPDVVEHQLVLGTAAQRRGEDVGESLDRLEDLDEQVPSGRERAGHRDRAAAAVVRRDVELRLEPHELLDAELVLDDVDCPVAIVRDVTQLVEPRVQNGGGQRDRHDAPPSGRQLTNDAK
jgi:hypothetical protein